MADSQGATFWGNLGTVFYYRKTGCTAMSLPVHHLPECHIRITASLYEGPQQNKVTPLLLSSGKTQMTTTIRVSLWFLLQPAFIPRILSSFFFLPSPTALVWVLHFYHS